MPNPNAIVSSFMRFDPPLDRAPAEMLRSEGGLSVELGGGRRVRFDPTNPSSAGFIQILEGLSKLRRPVYLEIDPATSVITRLLIPHVTRVLGIRPADQGGLDVELELSHARHILRRDLSDFAEMEQLLANAARSKQLLIVTEDDAHNIIDIRSFSPGDDWPLPPLPSPEFPPRLPWPRRWISWLIDWIRYWPFWPWCWCCMSMAKAQQTFNAMSATSCDPLTIPVPCIPFLYPDDGCWARAHEMCRLMINMGLSPRKVWIQGILHTATRNNPNCYVNWGWHVAPTLCVWGPMVFQTQTMVVDPSLFATPVSEMTWKSVQRDPSATLTETDASDYLWGATDPTYSQTDYYLAFYRLQLQLRATTPNGPPPYANCP